MARAEPSQSLARFGVMRRSTLLNTEDLMGRAERSSRGNGPSAPGPAPRIGRKDLQDPDRDAPEPDRPAPDGEPERSDRDADGQPVQLEIPARGQPAAGSTRT